jgi:hypothetical protein
MTEFVPFSIQGSLFVLRRDFILSHDWLLATMLQSDIPTPSVNGQLFLDVDVISFRVILSILKGTIRIDSIQVSDLEMTLLIATADYLLCEKISEALHESQFGYQKTLAMKNQEISQLKERADTLNALKKYPISLIKCNGYKTHRSFNTCGTTLMLLGPATLHDNQLECKVCHSVAKSPNSPLFTVQTGQSIEDGIWFMD